VRITQHVTLFAHADWLASAATAIGACTRAATLERRSADGARKAGTIALASEQGAGSLVLLAPAQADVFDPGQMLAAFDCRVEALDWQGEDLLLGLSVAQDVRAFSIVPGLRIHPAPAPPDARAGLHWLRLSTRRSRR
jgi:hypothetical protein